MSTIVLGLFIVAGVVTLFTAAVLIRAWALLILWDWFILPVFTSMPTLDYPSAIGISMIVGFLTMNSDTGSKDKEEGYTKIATLLFGPPMVVFLAWIVTWFM